jgi:hypothetical protein
MARQHATPLLISPNGTEMSALTPLGLGLGGHGLSEANIQELVHQHPSCLPIAEIDPMFVNAVPICRELVTPAGNIDNLLITPSGLPVLVECKLWRNPEGRREVIGQILDYSKELTKWSASDLQREANRRLGSKGNILLDLVRHAGHEVEEISFNDALTFNLRRGRFLLLIVGDGIREGVEAITEYLQAHAGLHFTLGLVEMPIYAAADGSKIVAPRVLARTQTILRTVIAIPDGMTLGDEEEDAEEPDFSSRETPEKSEYRAKRRALRLQFWTDFLLTLQLDDPEQMFPAPSLRGYLVFKFGAPNGSSWLTVYRDARTNTIGLFLSSHNNSIGERAARALEGQATDLAAELQGATVDFSKDRPDISDRRVIDNLDLPAGRETAIKWLQERTNSFINALRPRIRSAIKEFGEH